MSKKTQNQVVEDESIITVDRQKSLQNSGMDKDLIKVLLVEDDLVDRRSAERILAEYPHPIEFAIESVDRLSTAIEYLGNRKYDIILLDLGLPDSSGIETVRRVSEVNPHISIVVLTGLDDEETGLSAIKNGATDYLVKGRSLDDSLVRTVLYALERKQAEERIKRTAQEWRTTFDSITDMISIHDKNLKIVRVNEAFANAFKTEPKELIGKTCYEVFHGAKEPCPNCPHIQTLKTKKPATLEFLEPHLGIHVGVSTSPIFDENGELIASVHIAKDITERKNAEQRQVELFEKVESINKELKDFSYIVSHDLKAPLRGIRTLADWIGTDYADKLDDEGKEQIDLLLMRVERMHKLIDGILQYSRAGRVKEKQIRVNLNELVEDVIDMVAPPGNIEITIEDELPVVECGQTRIIQVFQNLLSNAVKYMDKPQGRIKIGCVEENGFWKFSVADNGPGIEEKHFGKIFRIFQTLSLRDEFESTGVGLTVVKKIVELYGGKIWVESKLGEGSTFFFTLPKQKMGVKDAKLEANIAR